MRGKSSTFFGGEGGDNFGKISAWKEILFQMSYFLLLLEIHTLIN